MLAAVCRSVAMEIGTANKKVQVRPRFQPPRGPPCLVQTVQLNDPASGLRVNSVTVVIALQSEEEEAEGLELAAGDWVAVSAEVERWNLLVCQLTDLLALRCFVPSLPSVITEQQASAHLNTLEGFSVLGKSPLCVSSPTTPHSLHRKSSL